MPRWSNPGAAAGIAAAVLFGASAPIAKVLLGDISPWLLAGLLYTGSGISLFAWRLARRTPRVRLAPGQWRPLAGAVFFGGVLGPVLLLTALASMPASGASLLLNAEGVFTAVIAWVVFRENADRRILLGFVLIVAGALTLSWPGQADFAGAWPTLALLGACLAWGIDNNLTRQVSLADASFLAAIKGAVAGPVNLVLALIAGATWPSWAMVGWAGLLGTVSYGVSLMAFIVAMRHVGTARAGAYFSAAPFFGAALAVAMGEPLTWVLVVAGVLMGAGVWLHLSETHAHEHTHEPITHDHWHTHDDDHHDHEHAEPVAPGTRHRHPHTHAAVTHDHAHFPDAHHRHTH